MLKVFILACVAVSLALGDSNWAGNLDYGIDRPGNDLPGMPVEMWASSTAADCQWKCYIDARCVSWAYDSCGHNRCWLKGTNVGTTNDGCRASGVLNGRSGPPPPPPPPPEPTKTADSCKYYKGLNLNGSNFFDGFNFFTGPDPTHGAVNYLNAGDARARGLARVNSDGTAFIGVDSTNKQYNGRQSVRIESKKSFTTGLLVIDMDHIPDNACGLWPAIWTYGPNWPNGGEIDILEGVNFNTQNQITLHTGGRCLIGDSEQKGTRVGVDCQVSHTTVGCGIKTNTEGAFGSKFNHLGGGAYVVERSTTGIKVWLFRRGQYPASLLSDNPNVCEFGTPEAAFPFTDCNQAEFGPQTVVINLSFCGDWADAPGLYQQSGCPGTCADYVANNPSAYVWAHFVIRSFRIYNKY